MIPISTEAEWIRFEAEQWRLAVRSRRLALQSLAPDERCFVFAAICEDLERRRSSAAASVELPEL
jgi:hypothetical protein